jgi:WD40 repeat protein
VSADGAYVVREDRSPEANGPLAITSVLLCRLPNLEVVSEFPHTLPAQFDLTKDASFLATLAGGTLRIWDTRDGALRFSHRAVASRNPPTAVMFSADGRYVATSDFRVFGVPNGEVAGVMPTSADGLFLGVGDGAQLFSGSRLNGITHVWSFQSIHRTAGLYFPRLGEFRTLLSPANQFFAASSAYRGTDGERLHRLSVWDLTSGRLIMNRSTSRQQVHTAFLSDKEIAVLQSPTDDGRDVEIVSLTPGTASRWLQTGLRLQAVGFLEPYGFVGLDGGQQGNRLVQIPSRTVIDTWPRDKDDECEFAQGPLVLCFGTTSGFRLFSPGRAKLPINLDTRAVVITPEKQVLIATNEKQGLHVFDADTRQTILRTDPPVGNAFFTDDTRFVAATGGGVLRIWDVASRAEIIHVGLPSDAAAVSAGSRYIVLNTPDRVQLWLWPFTALRDATCTLVARNRSLPAWANVLPHDEYAAACAETRPTKTQ